LNKLSAFLVLALALAWPCNPAADEIVLQQADGGELALEQPAKRLVTLSPHLAELVFAAGAGDTLLATVEYSNYPEAAAALPRVGDAFRLDLETIVALKPDLVIAWESGNPEAAVTQMRSLGLNVWAVEIRGPRQIGAALSAVGLATGREARANEVSAMLETRLGRLASRFNGAEPVRYFYQVDPRPLFTINGEHLISQGLSLCGGENIYADEPALAFQVAHESVIVENPDALIAPALPGAPNPLERWTEWPGMQAVQNGAMIMLHADKISRATPRWLDAVETACERLDRYRTQTPSH
jgi:iron complex transport system substrate-binding protein